MPRIHALEISTAGSAGTSTPSQRRFNTLLKQIENARAKLAAWRDNLPAFRKAEAEMLQPLRRQLVDGQRQRVFALAALLDRPGWTKPEREVLRDVLCSEAGQLLDGDEDAELKALFDKHSDIDFDTLEREALLDLKDTAEAMTGLDLGDDEGLESEEDLAARVRAAEEAQRMAKTTGRKRTAAQERREAEAQQVAQSMRDVYRKLASALHPDRETEAAQREEKTALMQRVNQAYAAKDLLALLELQLQIEQIDASHVANASDQRLKHYNKVLDEQARELRSQVQRIEMDFCFEFGIEPYPVPNPLKLGDLLKNVQRQWQVEVRKQQYELEMLADVVRAKQWLKALRRRMRESPFGAGPF